MIELSLKKTLNGSTSPINLDIEVNIESGDFVAINGKSGAGKTSILRMISGLLQPDEGHIRVDGELWFHSGERINVQPQKRKVGFVFQEDALFPNMNVYENLKFALAKGQSDTIIDQLISIIELKDLKGRRPNELSGGQKQRVSLARALVQRPSLLLMDEPLSALDSVIRRKLQDYLLQIHEEFGLTSILVTHDVSEIVRLADRMISLDDGMVIADGKPTDVLGAKNISGKFQFTGEVLEIEAQGFLVILSIIIGEDLVKVISDAEEVKDVGVGDTVLVASKAFNPIIKKIS